MDKYERCATSLMALGDSIIARKRRRSGMIHRIPAYSVGVITALTIAVFSSVKLMGADSTKALFFVFNTKKKPTHTVVTVEKDNSAPDKLKKIYEITELPEGFELTKSFCSYDSKYVHEYHKDGMYIRFEQWAKDRYTANDDTEYADIEYISINGHEGYIIKLDEDCIVAWTDEEYVFKFIYSNDVTWYL